MKNYFIHIIIFSFITSGCAPIKPIPDFEPDPSVVKATEKMKAYTEEVEKQLPSREEIFNSIFTEEETPYEDIQSLTSINGELAFCAKRDGKYFIVYQGKESREYDFPIRPKDIGGKLYFTFVEGDNIVTVYDTKVTAYDKRVYRIKNIWDPVAVSGKLAFFAEKGDRDIILLDGEEIGNEYERVGWPKEVNGKLAFEASVGKPFKKGHKVFMVYDGVEGEEKEKPKPSKKKYPYIAKDSSGQYVVYGDEIGRKYMIVYDPLISVGGRIAYVAIPKGRSRKFVIWGEEIINSYPKRYRISFCENIKDQLVYTARNDDRLSTYYGSGERWILYAYGKEKLFDWYFRPAYPAVVNGNLLYWKSVKDILFQKCFCVYNDEVIKIYDEVNESVEINGKQVLAGRRDNTWFLIKQS